ncbi:MAG: hypothetical protein EON55_17060 [Alphaproteobacteria bacterium]|nr:MAG: hypothetical protein EON55_17060 [Alphaproteobacteria bacterium]
MKSETNINTTSNPSHDTIDRIFTRPHPSHNVSYAGSLVTSEAGYASSTDLNLSPILSAVHFAELPGSLYSSIAPPLVYDSSAAETDESYQSYNTNDFCEEDFYSWSAGVLYQPVVAGGNPEHEVVFPPRAI